VVDQARGKTAKAKPSRGVLRRSIDWVWGTVPESSGEGEMDLPKLALEYERRARVAAELARRALEPPEPFSDGPPDALACGLYHQSTIWSLHSLAAFREQARVQAGSEAKPEDRAEAGDPQTSATDEEDDQQPDTALDHDDAMAAVVRAPSARPKNPKDPGEFEALWKAAKPDPLLEEANVAKEEIAEAKARVAQSSFETYADLPADDQVRWAKKLRVLAEGLVYGLELTSGRYSPPWLARTLKLGLIFVLLGGLVWGGFSIKSYLTELDNIARGKPWAISSTYPVGCRSPAQKCAESPNFFFHTQEQNQPWLEIDLGSAQRFSSVKVVNRQDCCSERAIPLILEVSSDGQKWQQLARKNELFTEWRPQFQPVEARWVRLRIPKKGILHLTSVDVYK
jgi:hypothetical protein